MSKGYAPHVTFGQRAGRRDVFEIHHVDFISNSGEVYDVDNLRILTPKPHVEIHAEVNRG